jgi:17beta-estradiol 17-dehydrogenase / very-long-chain 3-oxoacyl-CoA reductase
VVTGASDGIGKGYARELAHRGFNVVLHGRNPAKLDGVKKELSEEFANVNFRTIIVDASKGGSDRNNQIEAIVDSLKDLHVTILINNVGSSTRSTGPTYSTFDKDVPNDIDSLINVNARFPAQFTSAILPLLMAHHGPSLIINMGSMAEAGSPWLSIYSASKAFGMSWSRSLAREMHAEGRDVEILGIMTGAVTSTSHSKSPASLLRPDSRTYAAASLDRVGCGEYVVPGYWGHALLKAITDSLPDFMFSHFMTTAVKGQMGKEFKQQ